MGKSTSQVEPPMLPEEEPTLSLPDMPVYENHRVQAERPPEGLQVARDGELPEIPQEREYNQEQHESPEPAGPNRAYPAESAAPSAKTAAAVPPEGERIPTEAEPLTDAERKAVFKHL